MNNLPFIYDLEQIDLKNLLAELGEPSYRADQIWQGSIQTLLEYTG